MLTTHHQIRKVCSMADSIFKKCVLEEFGFLISQYGFKCQQADLNYLRFESDTVFVEFYYDGQRSYEMDFAIGLLGDIYNGKERSFYLGELVRFSDKVKKEDYKLIQASTPQKVTRLISKMSTLVDTYAKDFLLGNKSSFNELSCFRQRECNELALDITLNDIREAVQKAWKQKDYECIVKLYEPVKDHISQSEYKKLKYSRKKCSNKM